MLVPESTLAVSGKGVIGLTDVRGTVHPRPLCEGGCPESSLRENRHADWSSLTVLVGLLELGRRHVAERFEQAAAVVPRDPLERRELDVLEPLPRSATMISSVLNNPITLSASALSYESPVLPTDGSMPAWANRSVYRIDRYCTPRSL
jgi:hypothetical protein